MCAVLFIKFIAALNCCGLCTGKGRREYSESSVCQWNVSMWPFDSTLSLPGNAIDDTRSSFDRQYVHVCLIRQHDYCCASGCPQKKRPLQILLYWRQGVVRKPVSIYPPSATHLFCIEVIGMLIVSCGMLVDFSSMAAGSCWILSRTGTRCDIGWSRAPPTCSMSDTYGISADRARTARTGMFSASRNCVQIFASWGRAQSSCNVVWWAWRNGTAMGLRILLQVSPHIQNGLSKMHLCCPYHNPTATMGYSIQ